MKFFLSTIFTLLSFSLSTFPFLKSKKPILKETILKAETQALIITKASLKSTLLLNGEITTFSLTWKAVNLQSDKGINDYEFQIFKQGNLEVLDVKTNKNDAKYKINGKSIEFNNLQLKNNDEIDITIQYKITNDTLFFLLHTEALILPPSGNDYQGEIYVNSSREVELFGAQYDILKKKDDCYYWSGKVSNKGIGDMIYVGVKKAHWKVNYIGYLAKSSPITSISAVFITPIFFDGGNNNIKYYNVACGNTRRFDGKYIKRNKTHIIFNNKGKEAYYQITTEFYNTISSNWHIDLNNYKYKSTATDSTRNLAKEILSKDNSNDPDYLKLGKWVRKNLRFDMKYYGKKMTIDEIINNKIGVAEHYSILYNALLHSVNIPSIYIAGYVFDEPSDHTNLQTSRHAWNIVKINNKWVPIDSTMGFFDGKLPVSHVFESYFENGVLYATSDRNARLKNDNIIELVGYEK